jgi:serine/threonine protein kinase
MKIDGGWIIGQLEPRSSLATGGNFSQSYQATNGGKIAFVKALDFERAFSTGGNVTKILQHVLELFNFEVDMLSFCEQKRMDRVVRAIGSGILDTDGSPFGQVPYLLFERADGDIRKHLDDPLFSKGLAWKLRALHHIATGLRQLHGADVVHQDLKPSNILIFDSAGLDSGNALLQNSKFAPHDITELAAAFATLEFHHGNVKKRKSIFARGLKSQMTTASHRLNGYPQISVAFPGIRELLILRNY